jgi:peptidoglycan-binding protein ArfA
VTDSQFVTSVAFLILVGALILSVLPKEEHAPGNPASVDRRLELVQRSNVIALSGDVVDDEHREALAAALTSRFPDRTLAITLSTGKAASPDDQWRALTLASVDLLAQTAAATLRLSADGLTINGLAAGRQRLAQQVDDVAALGGPDFVVEFDTETVEPVEEASACRTMFASIAGDPVRFVWGTAELQPLAYPLLERYAEFALDCPSHTLAISGHTDARGDAEYNLELSLERADAVAAFLESRGVRLERLVTRGAGSLEPIADNSTIGGRSRNRRIEIELLEPLR